MLTMQALGTNFKWTLNQEIVFSAALTGCDWQAGKEGRVCAILMEKVCDRHTARLCYGTLPR